MSDGYETFEEWRKHPLNEKIAYMPDRHAYPIKCLIFLVMGLEKFNARYIEAVANRMGYELAADVAEEGVLDPDADRPIRVSISAGPTYFLRPELVIE